MASEDRMDRLERRVAALEILVRELATGKRHSPGAETLGPLPAPPAIQPKSAEPVPPASPPALSEQWLGQRGLLGLGVFALILAAGYFLKLAFDRGWVSPLLRCGAGGVAGLGIAGLGWRLHQRGLRRYGAALIGAGAAIAYLSVWAATALYEFLSPAAGIATLAVLSLGLAAVAFLIDLEWLGATAAGGALLAPILLVQSTSNGNVLLAYLGVVGLALGWVAERRQWRITLLLILLGCFGLIPLSMSHHPHPFALVGYGTVGGLLGIQAALRIRWGVARAVAFAGGWFALWAAAVTAITGYPWIFLGGLILAAPGLWRSRSGWLPPFAPPEPAAQPPDATEALYFYATALLLIWAADRVDPAFFQAYPGLATALIGAAYVAVGYTTERPAFALVGTTALLAAGFAHWTAGLTVGWVALGLGVLWALLDHAFDRHDGRWYALLAFAGAIYWLWGPGRESRSPADPAFTGTWALFWWATIAGTVGLARGLWRRSPAAPVIPGTLRAEQLLWAAAGILLLGGVTGEILRRFAQSDLPATTARLAGGLAVSAWWLLFAGALVAFGFRRQLKPARVAGLAVAALAALKVVFSDLASLNALYRVGSVLLLGLVSLGMAYLYNRKGTEV